MYELKYISKNKSISLKDLSIKDSEILINIKFIVSIEFIKLESIIQNGYGVITMSTGDAYCIREDEYRKINKNIGILIPEFEKRTPWQNNSELKQMVISALKDVPFKEYAFWVYAESIVNTITVHCYYGQMSFIRSGIGSNIFYCDKKIYPSADFLAEYFEVYGHYDYSKKEVWVYGDK